MPSPEFFAESFKDDWRPRCPGCKTVLMRDPELGHLGGDVPARSFDMLRCSRCCGAYKLVATETSGPEEQR